MNIQMRVINIFISIVILCAILSIVVIKLYLINLNIHKKNYILMVQNGDTLHSISKKLAREGVYSYPKLSFVLMRLLIGDNIIKSGEYEVLKGDNLINLINKIKNGEQYYRKITFVEGKMMLNYIEQINESYSLIGDIDIIIPEGYFMPGTYFYLYGETKNSILRRANEAMINFVNKNFSNIADKPNFYLKNINEILTLASIVEKETGIDSERNNIASVFYNRLKMNMRLQSDPTTIYEITKGKFELDRPITYKDLKIVGEYNTYRSHGIPIGPVASPSKKSIMAVLYPTKTDYLFFVASGQGGHVFAKTFEEHKNNIASYRKFLYQNYGQN